ncbi:hypothetical protein FKW77_008037 [Venturia effusa]|uniref:Uncharacterized protein n=1 Tax=Venturia effusa TaxID=50376 RepID=A0A517LBB4_9PEZI|nr:hypothetical protein FKW77_008037 [Venturia effusa]
MDTNPPFQRPKIRLRSSSATLPRSPLPASPVVGPQEPAKKHRHHHSVHTHHHIPHVSHRHARESQQSSGEKTGVHRGLSKPLSRVEQFDGSPVDSRRVSPARRAGRGENVSLAIGPEDIAKERQRQRVRDKELRDSLHALFEQSLKANGQFDDVYYCILEKLSVLQSMISNLQDLSTMTKNLHAEFRSETVTFETEMRERIDSFGSFDDPKQRIRDFETRITTSKTTADKLSARLESSRARVLALEAEEKEYQDMVSRRFRLMWIILGSIGAVVIALYTFQAMKQPSTTQVSLKLNNVKPQSTFRRKIFEVEELSGTFSSAAEDTSHAVIDAQTRGSTVQYSTTLPTSSPRRRSKEDDQRLHVLEEL